MKKYVLLLTVFIFSACTPASVEPAVTAIPATATMETANLEITSPAFKNGEAIPSIYSCDGNNTSPALTWTEPPAGTQSFVLIMDDPDAGGTWFHWLVYNIPASSRGLSESVPTDAKFIDGTLQGRNSGGTNGYQGPCPPAEHRYFFRLYALDTVLSLPAGAHNVEVTLGIKDHILANAELMGTYAR